MKCWERVRREFYLVLGGDVARKWTCSGVSGKNRALYGHGTLRGLVEPPAYLLTPVRPPNRQDLQMPKPLPFP
jgi:hypothetical protein